MSEILPSSAAEALSAAEDPFCTTAEIGAVETDRLILRPARACDAAAIAELADDPAIAANLGRLPHPYRLKDAEAWIARTQTRTEGFELVIEAQDSGLLIGTVAIKRRGFDRDPTLGFWIGSPFTGRGFATEAAQAAVDLAFTRDPARRRLGATTRAANWASRHVMEKCGFHWFGQGMERSVYLGGSVPVDYFCLERSVWTAIKAWSGRTDRRIDRR
jgi:RimJ/RimL family protein N-acetyltransferase